MIQYKCGKCGGDLESPDSKGGQTEQCPACGTVVHVPSGAPVVPRQPEAPPEPMRRRISAAIRKNVWPIVAVTWVMLMSASIFFGLREHAGAGRFQAFVSYNRVHGGSLSIENGEVHLLDTRTGEVYKLSRSKDEVYKLSRSKDDGSKWELDSPGPIGGNE